MNSHSSIDDEILSALEAENMTHKSKADVPRAVSELKAAIENYHRPLAPAVSLQRRELRELERSLEKTVSLVNNLSPQTLNAYCNSSWQITSLGEIGIPLRKALEVVQHAIKLANELENKPADTARNFLAYEVAKIMDKRLIFNPAATRDITEHGVVGNRGGAAYARLLRRVLTIAGDTPPDDLYPLIDRGLDILKNPRGDILIQEQ